MRKIKFMKHKKLSSMHYLTVNILGLDGDSLAYGALGSTTFSETTSTMEFSIDGADGNDGGGGWHICGAYWCPTCESTEDTCNKTGLVGGLPWNLTCCTSDCNSLGMEKGNPEAMPRCPGSEIVL